MSQHDSDSVKSGVYEAALDETLKEALCGLDRSIYQPSTGVLNDDDDRLLLLHADSALKRVLSTIGEKDEKDRTTSIRNKTVFINEVLRLCNEKLGLLDASVPEVLPTLSLPPEKLLEVRKIPEDRPNTKEKLPLTDRPSTGFATSTFYSALFRNTPHLSEEIKREIQSADSIDLLMSFIRWSGLDLVIKELRAFAARGGRLRVITTCYVGATDARAVEELSKLPGCTVKVEYEGKRSRLHAKAWIFKRQSGYSTAYIGSSNVSSAALTDGLEWNVKVTAQDMPDLYARIEDSFNQLWPRENFSQYNLETDREKLVQALKVGSKPNEKPDWSENVAYWPQLKPHDYQQRILNALDRERRNGFYKNLIIAATGTGKTMIAAFDFLRFRKQHPGARLLFIAHRQEILKQARIAFCFVLRQSDFGELFSGQQTPQGVNAVFAMVQTLRNPEKLHYFKPDTFDYIVLDEAHHAEAESYAPIFNYFQPRILLGMTATPERMDGGDIRRYFGGRYAAEIRLPDAIEYNMLSPFHYFVADDEVDLTNVAYARGKFDAAQLESRYTSGDEARLRANAIVEQIKAHAADTDSLRAIAFCAGIRHAQYMQEVFSQAGFNCECVSSKTPDDQRNQVIRNIENGDCKIVTVADLYNEGVDIPSINMVLFLRPTESLTIFLQQLGRGLRLSPETNKTCLTVLDFVGQVNKDYDRFESKFSSLLASRVGGLEAQIEHGFPGLPLGCAITFTEKSQKIVLQNIRRSYQNWKKFSIIVRDQNADISLAEFLSLVHLAPHGFYSRRKELTFTEIRRLAKDEPMAGLLTPGLVAWRKGAIRLAGINARDFLGFISRFIAEDVVRDWHYRNYPDRDQRRLWMLYRILMNPKGQADLSDEALEQNLKTFFSDSEVRREVSELVQILLERSVISPATDATGALEVHARYSRDAIYAALGKNTYAGIAGVYFFKEIKTDAFFVTFHKNEDEFAPSVRYNDYLEGTDLVHWESQNATSPESPVGQRYISQPQGGTHIQLFARAFKKIGSSPAPLVYLGEADYVSHKGSNPISFVWKLRTPLTAEVVKELADGTFAEDEEIIDLDPEQKPGHA